MTLSPLPGIWSLGFGTRRLFQERGLWRGGGGVDENRFGTVRQESKMCRIKHLLKLHYDFFLSYFLNYIRLPN